LPRHSGFAPSNHPPDIKHGGAEMKKGDKVMIYEDPITQLKPEGMATLTTRLSSDGDRRQRWRVVFDAEPDAKYDRNIYSAPEDL